VDNQYSLLDVTDLVFIDAPGAALEPFLREVEDFALGEYETALLAGSLLPEARQRAMRKSCTITPGSRFTTC
jgi:hypothetical protein